MANTYLTRTTGTPTNQNKWTWSAWVKFSDDNYAGASDGTLLSEYQSASAYHTYERINFSRLRYSTGVSSHGSFVTNRSFSDTNAFYHIVISNDWANSTTADRIKLYVNGVRETSFASFTAPSSGSSRINDASKTLSIGAKNGGLFFNGIMSHVHFIDGTIYDASAFGSIDSSTGEWSINSSPSVTYGNNGFFILKDGNSVTDQSGKGNNFAVSGGTLTKTEDCPDNVFATLNPLFGTAGKTYSNGNTTYAYANNYQRGTLATIAPSGTNKFYFEWKPSGNFVHHINLVNETLASDGRYGLDTSNNATYRMSDSSNQIGWNTSNNSGELVQGGSTIVSGLPQVNSTHVGQLAFDCATGKMWAGKDGTWHNSGNPATGANPTYTWTNTYTPGNPVWLGIATEGGATVYANFGNGYFGTTPVATQGTNASGNGIFELDVPTGFTAISTKGLNL
jgi:hypothetical protein